jgi:hypothetical protein
MKLFSKIVLLVLCFSAVNVAPAGMLGTALVYAADPPKKSAPRAPVRKRRPPPKKETEVPTSLPPSRGQDAGFEDTTGQGPSGKPVDAILVLDSSRSMQRNDPDRLRDQGARLFLQFLEPDDRFSLIEFGENANVLMPLTYLKNSKPNEVKAVLEGIQNEGNFTDFLFPLEQALELFEQDKRVGAEKVIILLSDGHMDPDPRIGNKEDRTKKLLDEVIPALSKQNIKLYSLALSDEADRAALKDMAKNTDGLSWYAKEVNEIHRIFSDLFLSIKKPQVLELTKDGFEIDGSTSEATFFVNRENKDDTVVVVDPVGKEFLNKDFPPTWKWFKGEMFDIITVPQPLPGTWFVTGGQSGFAKLLSDLKLEYSWPASTFDVGDSVVLKARLTESGKVLDSPELKNLVFYNYKVLNTSKGVVYLQGKLVEKEEGTFETTISLNDEGEYKLFLSVTSPTFTRQAHVPFSVSTGLVSLVHVPGNEFTQTKDSYEVILHPSTEKIKNIAVGLLNYVKGKEDEQYVIPLKDYKIKDRTYLVPLNRFKPGNNVVTAVISGIGEDRKKIAAKSEVLNIFVSEEASLFEEASEEESIDIENISFDEADEVVDKKDDSLDLILNIVSILLGLIVSFAGARFFIKNADKLNSQLESSREPYQAPAELLEQIQVLRNKSSDRKRPPNETEIELFSSLPNFNDLIAQYAETSSSEEVSEDESNEKEPQTVDAVDAEADTSKENLEDEDENAKGSEDTLDEGDQIPEKENNSNA